MSTDEFAQCKYIGYRIKPDGNITYVKDKTHNEESSSGTQDTNSTDDNVDNQVPVGKSDKISATYEAVDGKRQSSCGHSKRDSGVGLTFLDPTAKEFVLAEEPSKTEKETDPDDHNSITPRAMHKTADPPMVELKSCLSENIQITQPESENVKTYVASLPGKIDSPHSSNWERNLMSSPDKEEQSIQPVLPLAKTFRAPTPKIIEESNPNSSSLKVASGSDGDKQIIQSVQLLANMLMAPNPTIIQESSPNSQSLEVAGGSGGASPLCEYEPDETNSLANSNFTTVRGQNGPFFVVSSRNGLWASSSKMETRLETVGQAYEYVNQGRYLIGGEWDVYWQPDAIPHASRLGLRKRELPLQLCTASCDVDMDPDFLVLPRKVFSKFSMQTGTRRGPVGVLPNPIFIKKLNEEHNMDLPVYIPLYANQLRGHIRRSYDRLEEESHTLARKTGWNGGLVWELMRDFAMYNLNRTKDDKMFTETNLKSNLLRTINLSDPTHRSLRMERADELWEFSATF